MKIKIKGNKHLMKNVGQGQILQSLECEAKGIPTFLVCTEQLLKIYKVKRERTNVQVKDGEQKELEQGAVKSLRTKLFQEGGKGQP